MTTAPTTIPAPPQPRAERPYTLIKPGRRGSLDPRLLWRYRDLLYFLIVRDIQVRFGQTALGIAWVVLQPLVSVGAYTVFFGRHAGLGSATIPYPLLALSGQIAWQLFARIFGSSADSLVHESKLITKVYFPRALLALAHAGSGLLEFPIALALAGCFLAYYRVVPGLGLLALPFFVAIILLTAGGVGLFVAALNVRYRDVRYIVPFVVQLWFLASPVLYESSRLREKVPEHWWFVHALNPMVGAIDGFRWGLLGQAAPDPRLVAISLGTALALFAAGTWYFQRLESSFADEL